MDIFRKFFQYFQFRNRARRFVLRNLNRGGFYCEGSFCIGRNKNNLLNVYGFYYHTHQGGSSADLSSGEHYNFSSANAGRLRLGYRMTTRTSKISQVYTGLAYQFEHNGGVTARYKDYSTGGENHKGSSGMLELGWIIKPLRDNPWTVDINATGWIGNQRGVKAFAKIQKAF